MAGVVQDIVGNVREMVRSEMQLARAEMKQEASKARRAGIMMGAGSVFAVFCLGFLLLTLMLWFSTVMAPWRAALIVAAIAGIPAWIFMNLGRGRFKSVRRRPERAIGNLKENFQWLRHQTR